MTRDTSALCSYVLKRTGIGDYVKDPWSRATTSNLDEACVWLWPSTDTEEQRAGRVAALQKQVLYAVYAVRCRP